MIFLLLTVFITRKPIPIHIIQSLTLPPLAISTVDVSDFSHLGCQFFKTSDLCRSLVLPWSSCCLLHPSFFTFSPLCIRVLSFGFVFLGWRNGILSNLHKVTHQWLIRDLNESPSRRACASLLHWIAIQHSLRTLSLFFEIPLSWYLHKKGFASRRENLPLNVISFTTRKIGVGWTDAFTLPSPLEDWNGQSEAQCLCFGRFSGNSSYIHPVLNVGGDKDLSCVCDILPGEDKNGNKGVNQKTSDIKWLFTPCESHYWL